MNKKAHLFNIVAGIIIISSAILRLSSGSNNLPYLYIALFIIFYVLQILNGHKSLRIIGFTLTIVLLILSIIASLPRILPGV